MKPLAALIALIVASVPELVSLNISIEGINFEIILASLTSFMWQAPYVVPKSRAFFAASMISFFPWPKISGPKEDI